MKKWIYLIVPGTLLVLFLAFYFAEAKRTKEREIAHKALQAKIVAEKKAEKDRLDAKAREDAAQRAAQRAADEAAKEAKKRAEWEKVGREIQEATDKANREADASAKKVAELEIQLSKLHVEREKKKRELLDLNKTVELAKIDRRNAELEVQRAVEMVSRRAGQSSLTKIVEPPVAKSKS